MDYIKQAKKKAERKSMTRKQWGIIAFRILLVLIAVASLLLGMYMSGYNIISFIKKFYAWIVLGVVIAISIVASISYYKLRKK